MTKKLYSDRRWTDIPMAKVVGYVELTEEEKAQINKEIDEFEENYKKTGKLNP